MVSPFLIPADFKFQQQCRRRCTNKSSAWSLTALGSLWIATTNHVLRVTRDNLRNGQLTETDISEFGVADGLHGTEGVRRNRSVAEDPSGMIWFSLSSGLSVVDPGRLRRSSVPAIIHINADCGRWQSCRTRPKYSYPFRSAAHRVQLCRS